MVEDKRQVTSLSKSFAHPPHRLVKQNKDKYFFGNNYQMHYICRYRYNESYFMEKVIYHGSRKIIERPEFGAGNPNNDYGLGFYCTENPELAKEWASSSGRDGYANAYRIELEGMSVCNLSREHNILNWLAVLLENRTFDLTAGFAAAARDYVIANFLPDYKGYDIIIGYRADDSYFSFAKDFLNNSISLETLSEAMRLGELGEQIVMKSERAFRAVRFVDAELVRNEVYYPKKVGRDSAAREEYWAKRVAYDPLKGAYMLDIIREQWRNDDERLQ